MTSLKNLIRRFPPLFNLAKSVKTKGSSLVHDTRYARYNGVLSELKVFAPTPSGSVKMRYDLTLLAAKQIIPLLDRLARVSSSKPSERPSLTVAEFCESVRSKGSPDALRTLLEKHGSDKPIHGYHPVYASILDRPDSVTAILEVGLGTNNTDVFSNMGKGGKPGASLRAFAEFLPNARIYGADIDRRILFSEGRIKTFWVDQTDPTSFESLGREVGAAFDLIIDDGLHAPNANLTVLLFALDKLKPGGWLVIEDIMPDSLPVWHLVSAMLPPAFANHRIVLAANNAYMYCVQRAP